jgi:hypothetical protein
MDKIAAQKLVPVSAAEPVRIDRRKSERFPFSAVALLIEPRSQARMSVRIADISLRGCYADALNAMPVGTKVSISIEHGSAQIKTGATVTYSLPGMGMGLSFEELAPDMKFILSRWIAEVDGGASSLSETEELTKSNRQEARSERPTLTRLIGLMVQKNLLTKSEGNGLLDELLREN